MAGSRWGSEKVSNNKPMQGFEDQILYPSKGHKYNVMPKSQSIFLRCCITLYMKEHETSPRCMLTDASYLTVLNILASVLHLSAFRFHKVDAVPSVSAWMFGALDMLSA